MILPIYTMPPELEWKFEEYLDCVKILDGVRSTDQLVNLLKIPKKLTDQFSVPLGSEVKSVARGLQPILNKAPYFCVSPSSGYLTPIQRMLLHFFLLNEIGYFWPQNTNGDLIYLVFDRGLDMHSGARYSQTNQGGAYHTDGVNQEGRYDVAALTMLAPSQKGGDSVLIDGDAVLKRLLLSCPSVIESLTLPIRWESKGVSDRIFEAPILRLSRDETLIEWRYLRAYISAFHSNIGETLSPEIMVAMDALDEVIEDEALHCLIHLSPGDLLLMNDRRVFHGRTQFSDYENAISFDQSLVRNLPNALIKRTMARFWVTFKNL